jgi:hypothetical protein
MIAVLAALIIVAAFIVCRHTSTPAPCADTTADSARHLAHLANIAAFDALGVTR